MPERAADDTPSGDSSVGRTVMRDTRQVVADEWARWPGPEMYRPVDVPGAIGAVRAAADEDAAHAAYHRVLGTVGNDHRGTVYPAACAAAAELVAIVDTAEGWPRWAAVQILIDWSTSFRAEPGYETVDPVLGEMVDVDAQLRSLIRVAAQRWRIAQTADDDEVCREAIADLVEAVR